MMQQKFYLTRASHDFAHLRCSTQSVMIKVMSFHLDLYLIGRMSILKTKM